MRQRRPRNNPVLVELERGDGIEAFHRGAVAVVRDRRLTYSMGDLRVPYYVRSGAKWFQAAANVALGVADRYGLNDRALALLCASHGGEPDHVETALAMLGAIGRTTDDLACGAHWPMHAPSAAALRQAGKRPTAAHNNCSGKHTGMLMGALALEVETQGYENPDHPIQRRILEVLATFAEVDPTAIGVCTDGCSAPTFALGLEAIARAYANFGAPGPAIGTTLSRACSDLREAVRRHPRFLAGTGRFCTDLVTATAGRVLAKVGAEGFYGALVPDLSMGIAIHVDDGSTAAAARILAAVLRREGVVDDVVLGRLTEHVDPVRRNHAGRRVGAFVTRLDD